MTTSNITRTDLYERVTSRIVADLEKGVRPWLKPWNAEHAAGLIVRPLRCNGEHYQGINILMLWTAAEERGYLSPYWMTFQQAKSFSAHVRKGETSSPVVYASSFTKEETNDDGETSDREIPFLKQYAVFNAEQIEGLPERFYPTLPTPANPIERNERAERFIANTKADIRHGGNRAFHAIGADYIQTPRIECFRDAESYYATLTHELTHWTRHPSRLNRDLGRKRWGDAGYAMEELVAELGAAFLCADLGLTPEVREDHAAYVASWLQVLNDDKRAIFTAASWASKGVEFLKGMQG